MPDQYLISDGRKAVPLSALPADAWTPVDPLDSNSTAARKLRTLVPLLSRSLDLRGKAVANFPLVIERNGSDVSDTPEGRAILDKLRGLMYRTEVGLCVAACAYWEIGTNRLKRNVTPFWCATGTMGETRDPITGMPTFWRIGPGSARGGGQLDPRNVAAFYLPSDQVDIGPDPDVAPVKAALSSAGLLYSLDMYGTAFFTRGGVKITLLQVDAAIPKAERDKLKSWWDRMVRGVKDAFGSLVVSSRVEPKIIGSDPKDTAAPEIQRASREDVAVAMGVPLSLLLSDALAGGTADAERLNFYEFTVWPEVELILPVANEAWLSRLGLEVKADPDSLEVKQWAFAQRAEALSKLTGGAAILTVDEARKMLGLEPMEQVEPAPGPPAEPETAPVPESKPQDEETKALATWQRKALKRLRSGRSAAVTFDTPHLDADTVSRISTQLSAATTSDEVKAAFNLPEPGQGLSPPEQALYDALLPVLRRHGASVVRAVLAGEAIDNVALADDIRAAVAAAIAPLIAAETQSTIAAIGLSIDPADAIGLGSEFARTVVGQRVQGITNTTLSTVQKAVETYRATPGMTRAQLEAMIAPTFGPRRAETIAVTEITNAASAATSYSQDWLAERGLVFTRIWRTSADEKTCPVCSPLNGKTEDAWNDAHPSGPPAHPRCRCFVTLAEVEEANK